MIAVVGDALLDRDLAGRVDRLSPEAPVPVVDEPLARSRPGGAGLAAAIAAAGGREVVLVTALGRDAAADELRGLLAAAGVGVVDLGLEGPTPEKVRVLGEGRLLLRVDYGGPASGAVGALPAEGREALAAADGVLVADYGRGVAARPEVRSALERPCVVWDPHPRGPEPVAGARLATPNAAEAGDDGTPAGVAATGRALRARWRAEAVAVTLGPRGAVLVSSADAPLVVPAVPARGGDPCGAGDCFAATAACRLADGALVAEAVEDAVAAASRFVAAGGAGAFSLQIGGTCVPLCRPSSTGRGSPVVVATGGCFDLLHAGHVGLLEAARGLGDRLVVLLNSDASVRRLKGPDRPIQPQEDRAAVLRALAAVDEVVVFEEDTPEAALERLRPDLWAKGGDYGLDDLPEAAVVERWGGQAVILPYVEGRSTTRLIEELQRG